MRQYKNKVVQNMYDHLYAMGSPEALAKNKVFGALASAFNKGYEGLPMSASTIKNSVVYAAYWAGRDAAGLTDTKTYPTTLKALRKK